MNIVHQCNAYCSEGRHALVTTVQERTSDGEAVPLDAVTVGDALVAWAHAQGYRVVRMREVQEAENRPGLWTFELPAGIWKPGWKPSAHDRQWLVWVEPWGDDVPAVPRRRERCWRWIYKRLSGTGRFL